MTSQLKIFFLSLENSRFGSILCYRKTVQEAASSGGALDCSEYSAFLKKEARKIPRLLL